MTPLEKFKYLYQSELKLVDEKIISLGDGRPALINTLVSYILNSGGKRLRPVLLILCAKLTSASPKGHIELAACVELLHTATLFHDDVVDESEYRRGKKTANEIWGNSASVLVGDFLLAASFEIMAEIGNMEVIKVLSRASSLITQGEVKQLMNKTNIAVSEADYIEIITAKTAELFAAASRVGGITAGQNEPAKDALENFGRNLGIAFQIVDDLLDYSAEQEKLGKTIGDDFREGKVTLPLILTYEAASTEEKSYLVKLFDSPSEARNEAELQNILQLMAKYNAIQGSITKALEYSKLAKSQLATLPQNECSEALLEILEFSVDRQF